LGYCIKLYRKTELAQAVDVMMAQVLKENLRLDDQSKQVDFLFSIALFPKRNRKHVLPAARVPTHFLFSQTFTHVSI